MVTRVAKEYRFRNPQLLCAKYLHSAGQSYPSPGINKDEDI